MALMNIQIHLAPSGEEAEARLVWGMWSDDNSVMEVCQSTRETAQALLDYMEQGLSVRSRDVEIAHNVLSGALVECPACLARGNVRLIAPGEKCDRC